MFVKSQKPRQFNYKPRFYDPAKEDLDLKKKAYGIESDPEAEKKAYVPGSFIKEGRMRRMTNNEEEQQAEKKRRVTLRAVIFLMILIFISYVIVKFKGIEVMLEYFYGIQ
ncbi:MAG: hypothetical protein R3Y04_08010 [Rikenellaceae bacterium]